MRWFGPHSWVVQNAHALIVLAACGCAALWRVRARNFVDPDRTQEGLWLLALVLLVRAAFDPWDNPYYHLPFLLALMAVDRQRVPLLPLVMSVLLCLAVDPSMLSSSTHVNAPGIYAAVAIPALLALGVRVFCPTLTSRWRRSRPRKAIDQELGELSSATLA